jgi:hypothetical protein
MREFLLAGALLVFAFALSALPYILMAVAIKLLFF